MLGAARRAWGGDATVTDITPVCATERDAHASENLFVLAVNRGAVRDEAAPYSPYRDLNPNPDPNPHPDPYPHPNPNPNPNPDTNPVPSPNPDPNPNPGGAAARAAAEPDAPRASVARAARRSS